MLPWWWSPQRTMSNSVPEREKEILTGCVSFYTQWIDGKRLQQKNPYVYMSSTA